MSKRPTYQELYTLVQEQAKVILLLKAEIEALKHPKNSRNSSLPPSKDENRPKPNQSLRKKSGKKQSRQLRREGKT
mgnify:FL=1